MVVSGEKYACGQASCLRGKFGTCNQLLDLLEYRVPQCGVVNVLSEIPRVQEKRVRRS